MKPPKSAEIFESSISKYWFEGELVYIVFKKAKHPDVQTRQEEFENFRKRAGNKKVCAIMDISNANPSPKEHRELNSALLPKLFKAIAFVIKNPMTRMVANLYLGIRPAALPVKMFATEEEAKKWIKTQI